MNTNTYALPITPLVENHFVKLSMPSIDASIWTIQNFYEHPINEGILDGLHIHEGEIANPFKLEQMTLNYVPKRTNRLLNIVSMFVTFLMVVFSILVILA